MDWLSYNVNQAFKIDRFFTFFSVHYDIDFEFCGESHNFWEFLYVIKGSLCVSADEQVYDISEGDIIFHKPLELHKFSITHPDGADLLICSFSLDGSMMSYLKNKVFSLTDNEKNIVNQLITYAENQNYSIGENQMHMYLSVSSPTYLQMITLKIYELFISLTENQNCCNTLTTTEALIFRCAVDYMNNHICEQLSVEDISNHCNISISTLKNIFHKFAGIGVHKYFNNIKFNLATELLKENMSVSEVAEKLGFSSQSYFSVSYKRETGKNPSNA